MSDIVARYRIPGECDECATEAAALATGYPGSDIRDGCGNEGCRFYDERFVISDVPDVDWHPDFLASLTVPELLAENERLRAERDFLEARLAHESLVVRGAYPAGLGVAESYRGTT